MDQEESLGRVGEVYSPLLEALVDSQIDGLLAIHVSVVVGSQNVVDGLKGNGEITVGLKVAPIEANPIFPQGFDGIPYYPPESLQVAVEEFGRLRRS
jgi:hypothetical protein